MKRFLSIIALSVLLNNVYAQDTTNLYSTLKFNNRGEEPVEKIRDYKKYADVFEKILEASPQYKGLVGELFAKGKFGVPMHRVKLESDFADEQFIVNRGTDGEVDYAYFLILHEPSEAAAKETEVTLAKAIAVKMLEAGWGEAKRGLAPIQNVDYSVQWSLDLMNHVWMYHYQKNDQWVVELEILRYTN